MKRTRKGFTLVELLIVIALIGTLSAMMMVSSSEAQNSARVAKIVEGFRSLSAAMMMYYNENTTFADDEDTDEDVIIAGAKRYIKNNAVFGSDAETQGTYYVAKVGDTWWLSYQLSGTDGAINELLAKKAAELGLKKEATAKPKTAGAYEATGQTVYMNVR